VEKLARPDSAVLFIAADEPGPRLARKIGTRYGEAWKELGADYPPVLERLRSKLTERGVFLRMTHPNAAYTLEDALEAFANVVPEDRRVLVILDHLHAVTTRDARDDDSEKTTVERAVSVVLAFVRRRAWSIVALAEVTKAALHVETVKETPLQAFAGTRKIASRFDAAFLMVPEGERRVRVLTPKNRFGPKTPFTLEADTERWSFREVTEEECEEVARVEAEAARFTREREAEGIVLAAVDAADPERGIARLAVETLPGSTRPARRAALDRLLEAGTLEEVSAPSGPKGGPPGRRYRRPRP
jgi:hypothetical protein